MKKIFLIGLFSLIQTNLWAQQNPGLEETFNWLQNKIDSYSRYVIIDSTGLLTEVDYTLMAVDEGFCKAELAESAKSIGSARHVFNFSELDPASLQLTPIQTIYPDIKIHDDVYLINLKTKYGTKLIFSEFKGAYQGDKLGNELVLGVKTLEMGERMIKGIRHAISLCHEKDDLFR
ncbi:MAG: hypothetical protein ACNS62_07250 [Candidatus Cyclobacteriaceae bacterium M3_2C_046]